jgi:hypothetical protein
MHFAQKELNIRNSLITRGTGRLVINRINLADVSALLLDELYEAAGGESLMMLHHIVSSITLLRKDERNGGGCTDVVAGSDD